MRDQEKRDWDQLPDVRDGLTRRERVILYALNELQRERQGRSVPSAMLYGRVLELIDIGEDELQSCLRTIGSRPNR